MQIILVYQFVLGRVGGGDRILVDDDVGDAVVEPELGARTRRVSVAVGTRVLDDVEALGDGRTATLVLLLLVADPVDPALLLLVHAVAEAVRVDEESVAESGPGELGFRILKRAWKEKPKPNCIFICQTQT